MCSSLRFTHPAQFRFAGATTSISPAVRYLPQAIGLGDDLRIPPGLGGMYSAACARGRRPLRTGAARGYVPKPATSSAQALREPALPTGPKAAPMASPLSALLHAVTRRPPLQRRPCPRPRARVGSPASAAAQSQSWQGLYAIAADRKAARYTVAGGGVSPPVPTVRSCVHRSHQAGYVAGTAQVERLIPAEHRNAMLVPCTKWCIPISL
jgi:hypothetical protein